MAIYHLHAKVIKRSKGQSAVASASYISGEKLWDEREQKTFDYSQKSGIDYTCILAPQSAPSWMKNREQLWNGVEAAEKQKNAQLARSFDIALPKELSPEQNKELALKYIREKFVDEGMVADIAFHNLDGDNPHFHVMLTMRQITPDGFGLKVRAWNSKEWLIDKREAWAEYTNSALSALKIEEQITHLSLKAQGITDRIPQIHLGYKLSNMMKKMERPEELREQFDRSKIYEAINDINRQLAADYRQVLELEEEKLQAESDEELRVRALQGELYKGAKPSEDETENYDPKKDTEEVFTPDESVSKQLAIALRILNELEKENRQLQEVSSDEKGNTETVASEVENLRRQVIIKEQENFKTAELETSTTQDNKNLQEQTEEYLQKNIETERKQEDTTPLEKHVEPKRKISKEKPKAGQNKQELNPIQTKEEKERSRLINEIVRIIDLFKNNNLENIAMAGNGGLSNMVIRKESGIVEIYVRNKLLDEINRNLQDLGVMLDFQTYKHEQKPSLLALREVENNLQWTLKRHFKQDSSGQKKERKPYYKNILPVREKEISNTPTLHLTLAENVILFLKDLNNDILKQEYVNALRRLVQEKIPSLNQNNYRNKLITLDKLQKIQLKIEKEIEKEKKRAKELERITNKEYYEKLLREYEEKMAERKQKEQLRKNEIERKIELGQTRSLEVVEYLIDKEGIEVREIVKEIIKNHKIDILSQDSLLSINTHLRPDGYELKPDQIPGRKKVYLDVMTRHIVKESRFEKDKPQKLLSIDLSQKRVVPPIPNYYDRREKSFSYRNFLLKLIKDFQGLILKIKEKLSINLNEPISSLGEKSQQLKVKNKKPSNKRLKIEKQKAEIHEEIKTEVIIKQNSERLTKEAQRIESQKLAQEEAQRPAQEEAQRIESQISVQEEAQRLAQEEAQRAAQEEAQRIESQISVQEELQRPAQEEPQRIESQVSDQEEAQRLAQEEAQRKAREEAQKIESQRLAQEEAQRLAQEEAQRAAREEAQRKAREEAQRLTREEAQRKAREEAQRKAQEEAQRLAQEEAQRAAREEAQRKAREEAQRKAREEAQKIESQRLAQEEAKRILDEEAQKLKEQQQKELDEQAIAVALRIKKLIGQDGRDYSTPLGKSYQFKVFASGKVEINAVSERGLILEYDKRTSTLNNSLNQQDIEKINEILNKVLEKIKQAPQKTQNQRPQSPRRRR